MVKREVFASIQRQRFELLMALIFVLFLSQLPTACFSQEEEEVLEEEVVEQEQVENEIMSLTRLLSELITSQGDVILTNKTIVIGEDDESLMEDKIFYQEYQLNAPDYKGHKVFFYDCKFELSADNPLTFYGWKFAKLNFVGCSFDMPLKFSDCNITSGYPLLFENCEVVNSLTFEHSFDQISAIRLTNNRFSKQLIIRANVAQMTIDHCQFIANPLLFSKMDEERTHYQLLATFIEVGEWKMDYCTFVSSELSNVYAVNFEGTEMGKLSMFSNQMSSLNFTDAGVEKALLIDSLAVKNYIGIQNFDFPEANTNIPWDNLKGQKFALFQTELSDLVIPYQAKTDAQLGKTLMYNDLISMYKKINKLYLERGDIQSANGSYVEIKEIETSRQRYIQKVNPSTSNYVNLLLNQVLSYFSDYATNPGKSVRRAWELLLLFTFLYMLTFSEWDGMNYSYYLKQYKLFAEYLTSKKDIKMVYKKKDVPDVDLMEEIREDYLRKHRKVPKAIVLFGEPLHLLGRMRMIMMPRLITFFNFQKEDWASLNAKRKVWSGLMIFLIVVSFLAYVLVVKFFNGLIMSLNSFVVIGFGALPEKGLAMYICIIEGIIGWFLLTIFTITLFSQVLQGGA